MAVIPLPDFFEMDIGHIDQTDHSLDGAIFLLDIEPGNDAMDVIETITFPELLMNPDKELNREFHAFSVYSITMVSHIQSI